MFEYQSLFLAVILTVFGLVGVLAADAAPRVRGGRPLQRAARDVFPLEGVRQPVHARPPDARDAVVRGRAQAGAVGHPLAELGPRPGARGRPWVRLLRDEPVHVARAPRDPAHDLLADGAAVARGRALRIATIVWGLCCTALFCVNAGFVEWRGGWTVGPRYLVACGPFFAFGAACTMERLAGSNRARRAIVRGVGGGLALASVLTIGTVGLVFDTLPESICAPVRAVLDPDDVDRASSRTTSASGSAGTARRSWYIACARDARRADGRGALAGARRPRARTGRARRSSSSRSRSGSCRRSIPRPRTASTALRLCTRRTRGLRPELGAGRARPHHAAPQRGRALRRAASLHVVPPRGPRARARQRGAGGDATRPRPSAPRATAAHAACSRRASSRRASVARPA